VITTFGDKDEIDDSILLDEKVREF